MPDHIKFGTELVRRKASTYEAYLLLGELERTASGANRSRSCFLTPGSELRRCNPEPILRTLTSSSVSFLSVTETAVPWQGNSECHLSIPRSPSADSFSNFLNNVLRIKILL